MGGLARRDLGRLALGGAAALTASDAAEAWPFRRPPPGPGASRRVVVVGAGIAGLVAAWELDQAGFDVEVLEARHVVGGRVWTLRGGDRLAQTDGTVQPVTYDRGLYFEAGAARIPNWHQTMLGYCRRFGVRLEPQVNHNRAAFYLPAGKDARPVSMRQAHADVRGTLSELLGRAVRKGALDDELSKKERRRLLRFLREYADLTREGAYAGSVRAGFKVPPGAAEAVPVPPDRLPLDVLLQPVLRDALGFEERTQQQPTMLEPIGGMDRIPEAFRRELGGRVRLNAEARALRQTAEGVEVLWRDRRAGRERVARADYAVVAMPVKQLQLGRLRMDLPPAVATAVASAGFLEACKVAWQAPRFWETDYGIYGGQSFLSHEAWVIWYPSDNFHAEQGVLVGLYHRGRTARAFAKKPLETQYAISRDAVERIHPGCGAKLTRPAAVVWDKVPFIECGWIRPSWIGTPNYDLLNAPVGRVHFAGDHLSRMPSWQEGAAVSGQRAARMIAERARAAAA